MDPFIGEITLCGLTYTPSGWADCNGQLLSVAQYTALYSLLGTTFGGDGRTNFGLPDLRGRVILSPGAQPGGSAYVWGQQGGTEAIAIRPESMAAHGHGMEAAAVPAVGQGTGTAVGNSFAAIPSGRGASGGMYAPPPGTVKLPAQTVQAAGGNGTHDNVQPYLGLRYIIALTGTFPQRP